MLNFPWKSEAGYPTALIKDLSHTATSICGSELKIASCCCMSCSYLVCGGCVQMSLIFVCVDKCLLCFNHGARCNIHQCIPFDSCTHKYIHVHTSSHVCFITKHICTQADTQSHTFLTKPFLSLFCLYASVYFFSISNLFTDSLTHHTHIHTRARVYVSIYRQ